MHNGKIKKIVRDRGFGFIIDTDGREVFFHHSGLIDAVFDNLNAYQGVEFEVEDAPRGPRAVKIRLVD